MGPTIKLGVFSNILKVGFTDVFYGCHYTHGELDADGSTPIESEMSLEDFDYVRQPCRLSFPKREVPSDSEIDEVPLNFNPKIFCCVDVDMRPGDYVVVDRLDDNGNVIARYEGTIGVPEVFVTHKEVLFHYKESA